MGSSGLPQTGVELVAQNLQGFLGDLNKGNQAVAGFGRGMDDVGRQTTSASQIIIGGLRQVGVMAVDALFKAGRAIVGFGQDSLRVAGDFQAGMSAFQVAAGQDLDASGLEQFHDLFIQLGKDLPVSTSEVQQAATEMVKGGLDPAILAAGGLKQNIQFAAAAMGGDLVGAAEISAKIVAGWANVGADAAEKSELLAHATDLLTKAANASSVDVHELSLGLFNVQATAKNAGISLDDVTTVLAELAGDFASSSEAGNSMASFITRLHPTTKAATEAMESLGLVTKDGANAFYDAQGNFVGFQKASEILKQSMAGLNNEQRQQIMQTIFQKDAMGVAAGLAARGAAGYDAMAASLQNAMGVTQAGQTIQSGYNTALENAMGSIEALKITIGEAFLPVLTDLLNTFVGPGVSAITTFAGSFAKMLPAILASEDPIQTFLNALKVAAPGALDFVTSIESAKDTLMQLQQPLTDIATLLTDNLPIIEGVAAAFAAFTVLTTVAGWISTAVGAVASLGAAFTAAGGGIGGVVALLGGPVTLTIAAVAGAIGLLVVAWQNDWGGIQEKTAAVWEILKPIFDQAVSWLQVEIPKAIETASNFWTTTLWPAIQQVADWVSTNVFPILSNLANVYLAAAGEEVSLLAGFWTGTLWPALKTVGSFIKDVIWPIFKALFEVEFAIAAKVVEALAGLWQKVLWPALQAVGSYITTTVVPAFESVGSYLSQTFSPLLDTVSKWLTKITGGFTGVSGAVDYVTGKIKEFANSITNLKLPSWLTPGSPTPWEIALYGIGTALTKSVSPGLEVMGRGVKLIGDKIQATFANTDMVGSLTDLGQDVMDGFAEGLKDGLQGVRAVIRNTSKIVENAFKGEFQVASPSRLTWPIGEFVSEGFLQGMMSKLPDLMNALGEFGSDIVGKVKDISDEIQDAIADGFSAQAAFNRAKMQNVAALGEMTPEQRAKVQGELDDAEQKALTYKDPQQAAAYYQMRSKQIMELAQLQEQLNTGLNADQVKSYQYQIDMLKQNSEEVQRMADQGLVSQEEVDRLKEDNAKRIAAMEADLQGSLTVQQRADLEARIALLKASQEAELKAFDSKPATDAIRDLKSQYDELVALVNDVEEDDDNPLKAMLDGVWGPLGDVYQQMVDAIVALNAMLGPSASSSNAMGSLPAVPAQMFSQSATTSLNTQNTVNYNMPIYTSNSPAALQQSFALLKAATL